MVRHDCATALAHDRRVRNAGVVAQALHVVNDVVGVFLQRVVGARFKVGLRAVVVDAEAAADVDVFETRPAAMELDVHAGRFVERLFDVADVRDLASEMEVQELEAVLHSLLLELVERAEDFGDRKAELRAVTARALPTAGALGGELHAHAELRADAHLLRVVHDELQFGVLLDDRNDLAADLLREHRHFDELGVFEAVADDRRVVAGHGDDGHQLRLAAGFQAEVVRPAVLEHFFHHLALLVHLDRIDAAILAVERVFLDRALERFVDFPEAVLEHVAEAEENRQVDAAELEIVDELFQVDKLRRVFRGVNEQIARLADGEVTRAPATDVVHFGGIAGRPRRNLLIEHGRTVLRPR